MASLLSPIYIPNLVNGVSQQPPSLRLASQCQVQENFASSVVDGLKKRAPSSHVAKLSTGALASPYIHAINRDVDERYIVVLTDGDLVVYDMAGVAKTVAFPDGKTYLDAASPSTTMRAMTVADYTFVVNTGTAVAMDAATSASNRVEAMYFLQQISNSVSYNVTAGGVSASYTSPATGAVSTITATASLAATLSSGLGAGYTVTAFGPIVHVTRTDNADFTIKSSDSRGDTYSQVFKNTAQKFSELPIVSKVGFTVEILGDNTSNFDNYYVKFVPNNSAASFDSGQWQETVEPGIEYAFDQETMPHVLVREADGSFTFREQTWEDRIVGDAVSAENPSFVGGYISDVFLYKNRLGFLSADKVILSEVGQYFNFWPTTVLSILDTRRIDLAATHTKAVTLRAAVPFDEKLILLSDQTQFSFGGADTLTSKNAAATVTTEFGANLTIRPVSSGDRVYFPTRKGSFSGVREYFVNPDSSKDDAVDVTAHVPKYIPQDVTGIAASANESTVAVITSGDTSAIYIYNYFWENTKKLQSSWSKWTFENAAVLSIVFVESKLFVVLQRSDAVYLEALEVEDGNTDTGTTFLTHLDRRVTDTQCTSVTYDALTGLTTFALPFDTEAEPVYRVVSRYDGVQNVGEAASGLVVASTTTLTVNGDWSAKPVFIGQEYTSLYTFSQQYKRVTSGNTTTVAAGGSLYLRTLSLIYNDSGAFTLEVTHRHRPDEVSREVWNARVVGDVNNAIGALILRSGSHLSGVLADAKHCTISISSSSFLPCQFSSAEFLGSYTRISG